MKKITFLFLLLSGAIYAQGGSTFLNYENDQINAQTTDVSNETIINRVDNGRQAIIGTFTTLEDFNAAVNENCSDITLISEDFLGGPAAIQDCGLIISDAGDACYPAGELESGFDVQASNGTNTVSIPAGAIGNIDPLVGALTFAEFTTINFSTEVFAVAMDIWENSDPTTTIRIFGEGDVLIDTFIITTAVSTQEFFGFVSGEIVTRIELEGTSASGELFGNFLYGGDCLLSVNDNLIAQIEISPSPLSDILSINVPSEIRLETLSIYDLLGKRVIDISEIQSEIDVSSLNSGIYILNIKTDQGSLSRKLVKR